MKDYSGVKEVKATRQLNEIHDRRLNPGLKKTESYKEHYWGNWRSLNLDLLLDSIIESRLNY